jgi:hypothetical protein
MKIRSGFVSNSSSSSFCILGKTVTSEEYDRAYTVRAKSQILTTKNSISYEGEHYAGACPEKMKDDETLAQFKQRIVEELHTANIAATTSELDWITDGGYNG